MSLPSLLFYVFATTLLAAGCGVVLSRSPVRAVLFLIVAFFQAAGLFLLMEAEFLAFVMVIVYVGAVAVLFLFVVMMLDMRKAETFKIRRRSIGIGAAMGALLMLEMIGAVVGVSQKTGVMPVAETENTRALGMVLYTDYAFPFEIAGVILLVAMVGAVVLTLREGKKGKRQNAREQVATRPEDVLEIRHVKTGEGA